MPFFLLGGLPRLTKELLKQQQKKSLPLRCFLLQQNKWRGKWAVGGGRKWGGGGGGCGQQPTTEITTPPPPPAPLFGSSVRRPPHLLRRARRRPRPASLPSSRQGTDRRVEARQTRVLPLPHRAVHAARGGSAAAVGRGRRLRRWWGTSRPRRRRRRRPHLPPVPVFAALQKQPRHEAPPQHAGHSAGQKPVRPVPRARVLVLGGVKAQRRTRQAAVAVRARREAPVRRPAPHARDAQTPRQRRVRALQLQTLLGRLRTPPKRQRLCGDDGNGGGGGNASVTCLVRAARRQRQPRHRVGLDARRRRRSRSLTGEASPQPSASSHSLGEGKAGGHEGAARGLWHGHRPRNGHSFRRRRSISLTKLARSPPPPAEPSFPILLSLRRSPTCVDHTTTGRGERERGGANKK